MSNDTEAVRSEEVEVDDDEEDEDDGDSNDDKDDKGNAAAAAPRGYAAKSRPSKEFGPRDEDQHHRGLRLKSVPRRRASTPQALRHDQQQRRRAMSPPGGTEWVKRHNELARGPRVSRDKELAREPKPHSRRRQRRRNQDDVDRQSQPVVTKAGNRTTTTGRRGSCWNASQ